MKPKVVFKICKSLIPCIMALVSQAEMRALEAADETAKFEAKSIDTIKTDIYDANFVVKVADVSEIQVKTNREGVSSSCTYSVTQEGSTLKIESKYTGWFSSSKCKIKVEITVPKDMILNLEQSKGQVDLTGDFKKIEMNAGAVNVNFKGVVPNANYGMGAGNLDLKYTKAPETGELTVSAGASNVKVTLPKASSYVIANATGMRKITEEIAETKDSNFKFNFYSAATQIDILEQK